MTRIGLFAFFLIGTVLAVSASYALTAAPALFGPIEVSAAWPSLFTALAVLAVTAAAGVVVALGLVSTFATQAVNRALTLDFPAPQTGTPQLTAAP